VADAIAACNQPAKEASSGYHTLGWAFLRFCIHREVDTVREIEPVVRAVAHAASSWPAMRYWLVCTLAAAGAPDARLEFEGIAAKSFRDVPDDLSRLVLLALSAEACAVVGSASHARQLYSLLVPFNGRHIQFGNAVAYFDSASHLLGRLAMQLEEWQAADKHFSEALQQTQALGAACRAAHIQFHWALMLVHSGQGEHLPRAHSLLEGAAMAARHLELSGLVSKVDSLISSLCGEGTTTASREPVRAAHSSTVPPPASTAADVTRYVFRCEGEFWTLEFERETMRLKHTRGLQLIAALLRNPGIPVHALELAAGDDARAFRHSSTGSVLDAKARDAYRRRLHELAQEQAEAEAHNDTARVARARQESEILTEHLAAALGIGGRNRRTAVEAERARINVTRSIRSAISRMMAKTPALAHHLNTSIRTGTFCQYVPDPSRKIDWEL
jgi:hypothetical protein